jgi:RNA polymerase sigma-70 factor (ECF subfamily)
MDEIKLSSGLPGARGMAERVRRACMRYVQNRDEADDVAQEVMIKVFRSGKEGSGETGWVLRVAANQCLDHLRREKRQRMRAAAWAREHPGEEGRWEDSAEDRGDFLERLRERLNAADRRLLHLRFDLGLSQAAIAEMLGVSRPRIGQRLESIRAAGARIWRNENAAPVA